MSFEGARRSPWDHTGAPSQPAPQPPLCYTPRRISGDQEGQAESHKERLAVVVPRGYASSFVAIAEGIVFNVPMVTLVLGSVYLLCCLSSRMLFHDVHTSHWLQPSIDSAKGSVQSVNNSGETKPSSSRFL